MAAMMLRHGWSRPYGGRGCTGALSARQVGQSTFHVTDRDTGWRWPTNVGSSPVSDRRSSKKKDEKSLVKAEVSALVASTASSAVRAHGSAARRVSHPPRRVEVTTQQRWWLQPVVAADPAAPKPSRGTPHYAAGRLNSPLAITRIMLQSSDTPFIVTDANAEEQVTRHPGIHILYTKQCPVCRSYLVYWYFTEYKTHISGNGMSVGSGRKIICPNCQKLTVSDPLMPDNDNPPMEGTPFEPDWVRCPNCRRGFRLSSGEWTGQRHRRCGQLLNIRDS